MLLIHRLIWPTTLWKPVANVSLTNSLKVMRNCRSAHCPTHDGADITFEEKCTPSLKRSKIDNE